jgi:hypothetical protein
MSEILFKKLVRYFGLAIVICLIPLIISILFKSEPIIILSSLLLGMAIVSEITIISVFYSENKNFRRATYILIPVCSVIFVVSLVIPIPADVPVFISGIIGIIAVSNAMFIFSRKKITLFIYILVALIFVGIIFKRFHLPLTGVILVTTSVMFSIGIFIFGILSILQIKKNRYLSILIPVCSTILSIDSLGAVFKLQHWPGGGYMLQFSAAAIILVTIIVLLTIPQSGYFNWRTENRKSFYRNIVVPWIIASALIAYYFLIPQQTKEIIFPPRWESGVHFRMFDYKIEQPDTLDTVNK